MKFKLLRKITGWLVKKTDYELALPVQTIYVQPQDFKRFRCQHTIPYYEWHSAQEKLVESDYFIKKFKYQVVDKLLNEITIKADETPDGVMYSADLFFKNI